MIKTYCTRGIEFTVVSIVFTPSRTGSRYTVTLETTGFFGGRFVGTGDTVLAAYRAARYALEDLR